ncbi:hypothetical protein [Caulobacter sp. 602-2]|nr:hypothetical protein [Caulobacter sp. 602-2]
MTSRSFEAFEGLFDRVAIGYFLVAAVGVAGAVLAIAL